MTCELYTLGKWHTAACYKKPPAPCGASHLFWGWGGSAKKQVQSLLLETQKNKWEGTKTVC